MKKRIGIVLLALLLIVSLGACREAQTPDEERAFAAYMHYLELIGGAWDADFTMDMEMDISVMTIRTVSTGHAAAIVTDDRNMRMVMDMHTDMGMLGSMDMIMFMAMTDGAMEMRMIVDGQEMPEAMLAPEMFDDMTDSMTNVPLFELGDIVSVEVEEDGDYTTFHLLLDVTAMSDFMEATLSDQMGEMMAMLGDDAGMTMSFGEDMALTLTVYGSDDNPVALTMDMEMRMGFEGEAFEEMDGEEMVIRAFIEYRYNAFGDAVVVEAPAPAPEFEFELPMTLPAELPEDPADDLMQNPDFFGTWVWDADDTYEFTFEADGWGTRGFYGARADFQWGTTEDGVLIISIGRMMPEMWEYSFDGDVLTLSSLDFPGEVYSYIRI